MDPKDMSDEELDAALNNNPNPDEDIQDPSGTPTPDDAGTPSGGPQRGPDGRFVSNNPDEPAGDDPLPDDDQGQPDANQEPQVNPDEPKPPSRREQLRIQQVLERVKQGQQRPQGPPPSQRQGALDYANELDAPPEVIRALEEDRRVAEEARYQEGLRQAQGYEWRTLLHVDAPNVERDHPQLDKNSSEFHPALSHSLSTMYLQMSGYDENSGLATNPGMRWADFVDSIWELADEIAATRTQQVQQQVARQAAQTGIRPNGTASKLNLNKAPEHMTDEELDAFLAANNLAPQKRR